MQDFVVKKIKTGEFVSGKYQDGALSFTDYVRDAKVFPFQKAEMIRGANPSENLVTISLFDVACQMQDAIKNAIDNIDESLKDHEQERI